MKAFFGLLLIVGMVLSQIVGYQFVVQYLPGYLTMWWLAAAFCWIGLIGASLAD